MAIMGQRLNGFTYLLQVRCIHNVFRIDMNDIQDVTNMESRVACDVGRRPSKTGVKRSFPRSWHSNLIEWLLEIESGYIWFLYRSWLLTSTPLVRISEPHLQQGWVPWGSAHYDDPRVHESTAWTRTNVLLNSVAVAVQWPRVYSAVRCIYNQSRSQWLVERCERYLIPSFSIVMYE